VGERKCLQLFRRLEKRIVAIEELLLRRGIARAQPIGPTHHQRWPDISATATVLSALQVRALLGGKSEMFLYRLLTERPELNFPRPFKINGRNHWHRAKVEAWIVAQAPSGSSA
jgi:predicted DNA-binding transcriptional regulator AlpA